MDLQEHWGISHQQLPVIDMLLFGCDLFFFLIQFLKGKINRRVTVSTAMAIIWGPRSQTCFLQARAPARDCAGRQLAITHLFLGFPSASESYPGGCVLHCVEEIPVSEEPALK